MSVLEFISSLVSSIAWPAVVGTLGLVFRKQVKSLVAQLANRFDRLTSIKGGGFEAQFADLREIEKETALAAGPIYGGTTIEIWGGEGERDAQKDIDTTLPIEVKTEAEAEVEPGTGRDGPPRREYWKLLDADVSRRLAEATVLASMEPRRAVLLAGRALDRSIITTLDSLNIAHGVDAKGPNTFVPPLFALRHAGVVDDAQAEVLESLHQLNRSALHDTDDEITKASAQRYVGLVRLQANSLARRLEALTSENEPLDGSADHASNQKD